MAKISANKLGEYLVASPTRRKTIVREQKNPPTQIVARYRLAASPVEAYFTSGGKNERAIDDAVVRLRSDRSGTDWAQQDRGATADALDALLKMKSNLFGPGMSYVAPPQRAHKLSIAGVDVSVQPDFIVHSDRKAPSIGAVKLHFIKADDSALTAKGAEYVATLLYQWVMQHGGKAGRAPSPGLCSSVDIFRGVVVYGPTSQTRRMADITAACEEIAARWPTL